MPPPPPHIPFSKDKHAPNELIVHDPIIAQVVKLGAHKNNNFDVPHHKTRFYLLHTPITPSMGGAINENSIHGDIKATFKWQRQK
jgi:hypothetical protein